MTELSCSLRSLQIALEPDGDFKNRASAASTSPRSEL